MRSNRSFLMRFLLLSVNIIFYYFFYYPIIIYFTVNIRLDLIFKILLNSSASEIFRFSASFLPIFFTSVLSFLRRHLRNFFYIFITCTIFGGATSAIMSLYLFPILFPKSALCQASPNCIVTLTGSFNKLNDGKYETASPRINTEFIKYLLSKYSAKTTMYCSGEMNITVKLEHFFPGVEIRVPPTGERRNVDFLIGDSFDITYCDKPPTGEGTTTGFTLTIRDRNYDQ
jgi:hypothetical protein